MAWRIGKARERAARLHALPPILLVEDTRLFTSVLTYRFERDLGLKVVSCPSFELLAETIAAHPEGFSLAVVDLNLPGSPHGEVLGAIATHAIPTIVFTASFDFATREQLRQHDVMDYVLKDSSMAIENIFSAVRRAVTNAGVTVVVADPQDDRRTALAGALRNQNYRVLEAAEGFAALKLLDAETDVALVLADDRLAGLSGPELTRRIRRRFTADALRVIGMSGSDDPFVAVDFLKSGAQDCVSHPVHVDELRCRVANGVEAMRQAAELRAAAASDYLTALFNRRYFYAEGPKLISKCLKQGEPASICVLDIDHFKRLNDTYGHEIGDRVLCAVADRLSDRLDDTGHLLCRLGGEEFGILLTRLDSRQATAYLDELRRDIQSVKVMADEEELSVTISIGAAEVKGYETFDNYINAADQFLYMAKHRGRNQVYSDWLMADENSQKVRVATR